MKKIKKSKNFWLLKSEPETFSIEDLQKVKTEIWTGVRNFQARNFMRDQMNLGDICFFYHSSCPVPGIAGLCQITKVKVVDETQFDKKSPYFDSKSSKETPKWICVEVKFVKKFPKIISLQELKKNKKLEKMVLLVPRSRLSVQPVMEKHYNLILDKFFPVQK